MTTPPPAVPDPAGGSRAKPVTYRGILMPRIMACYAIFLDTLGGADWEYEPGRFLGQAGWWSPDFAIAESGGLGYVMVRATEQAPPPFPPRGDVEQVDGVLRRMESAWITDPGCGLTLVYMRRDGSAPWSQLECDGPGSPWWWRFPGDQARYSIWPGLGQLTAVLRIAQERARVTPALRDTGPRRTHGLGQQ